MRFLKWLGIYLFFLAIGGAITLFFLNRDMVLEHRTKVETENPDLNRITDTTYFEDWRSMFKECTGIKGKYQEIGCQYDLSYWAEGETVLGTEEILKKEGAHLLEIKTVFNDGYTLVTSYVLTKSQKGYYWLDGKLTVRPKNFWGMLALAGSTESFEDKLRDEMAGVRSVLKK